MALVSDILLIVGALGAMAYCVVLSRRLKKFNDLETGVGGAIALLSAQVDDMTKTLENARKIAHSSVLSLDGVTERAEAASKRLELLMASLHDLPSERPEPPQSKTGRDEEAGSEGKMFLSQRGRVAGAGR